MSAVAPLADLFIATRDRGHLVVRPMWAGDVAALRRMHSRLSPETIYRRFMTSCPGAPSVAMLRYLTAVDHRTSEALVALDGEDIVAVARYHTVHDAEAEIAVLVEDAWQRQGIARRLVSELTHRARSNGIQTFSGAMLAENRAAVGLMKSLFADVRMQIHQGEIEFTIPLADADPISPEHARLPIVASRMEAQS